MLPSEVAITDNAVDRAERLLLPTGRCFKEEQRVFIKDLHTVDLQAVPGSGKTTALIGKLLALSSSLPFGDGSGVLVLSHTNNAVSNFVRVLQPHCPGLFAYPNFVGTIQSFTDHFLAVPCYMARYGKAPYRIDDDAYDDRVYEPGASKGFLSKKGYERRAIVYESVLNRDGRLVYGAFDDDFPLNDPDKGAYKALLGMKTGLRQTGVLRFLEAYVLAFEYLRKHPAIKRIMRARFPFVFVDEMQDMDRHQYELLEALFFDNGDARNVVYPKDWGQESGHILGWRSSRRHLAG